MKLVGPSGVATRLEKSLLKIDDMRFRPDVLYNMAVVRHRLRGAAAPPAYGDVERWVRTHRGIIAENTSVIDDKIEIAAMPDDVNNVREDASRAAASEVGAERARAAGADDGAGAAGADRASGGDADGTDIDEEPAPAHNVFGCSRPCSVGMDTVVGEIAKMFSGRGNGGDGDDGAGDEGGRVGDNGDGDSDSAAAGRGVAMQRADEPRDDYTHGGANVMRAFWPLFVLGRGLPLTRTLNKEDYRHLMRYYDLRFARDLFLVLHLANVIMRHEVNRAVGARVNSSAEVR